MWVALRVGKNAAKRVVLGDDGDNFGRAALPRGALCRCAVACLTLAQCGSASKLTNKLDPKYGVSASPRVVQSGEPVPSGGGTFRVGRPYTVAGRLYVPEEDRGYSAEGLASWYGDDFHGRLTANGEVFDMTSISAAHPTLPMPSYARVTNLRNGKSLIVRVNDRGPFHANRVIDVSYRAANLLEFETQRHRARSRRICRTRLARRFRRPAIDGDAADRAAGAAAVSRDDRLGPAVRAGNRVTVARNHPRRHPAPRRAALYAWATPAPMWRRSARRRRCRRRDGRRRSRRTPAMSRGRRHRRRRGDAGLPSGLGLCARPRAALPPTRFPARGLY